MATFEQCLDLVWKFDGLRDDAAPGEKFATSYGITQMTWDWAVGQGIVHGTLVDGTIADFSQILRSQFWNALHCSSLNSGVDLMAFNDGVLAGVGHTSRLIQRAVGAIEDGVIGPTTLRLLNSFHPGDLIDKLKEADEEFYASLKTAPLYLNGWTRREEFMAQQAHMLSGKY